MMRIVVEEVRWIKNFTWIMTKLQVLISNTLFSETSGLTYRFLKKLMKMKKSMKYNIKRSN